MTRDDGVQPVLWIGRKRVRNLGQPSQKKARPVVLRRGSVGNHAPLRLSGQHAVLFGDYLVRARHLADCFGGAVARIDQKCETVTYFHLLTPSHTLVKAEGAWVETFYPGEQSQRDLHPRALAELQATLGSLVDYGPPAKAYAPRRALNAQDLGKPALRRLRQ